MRRALKLESMVKISRRPHELHACICTCAPPPPPPPHPSLPPRIHCNALPPEAEQLQQQGERRKGQEAVAKFEAAVDKYVLAAQLLDAQRQHRQGDEEVEQEMAIRLGLVRACRCRVVVLHKRMCRWRVARTELPCAAATAAGARSMRTHMHIPLCQGTEAAVEAAAVCPLDASAANTVCVHVHARAWRSCAVWHEAAASHTVQWEFALLPMCAWCVSAWHARPPPPPPPRRLSATSWQQGRSWRRLHGCRMRS